ncbi:transporter substrate-binding domain-containing protein [uncultured Rhodoferax sp.]|uniref:substrate-binding periplasmic protein n=1 Tax=uncultured Rhodoferax sp. TaxID=223188 RepID=UPI0025F4CFC8|nr:transporter substrate-binding domain-containing protein [uncultured Rhodoferax sp.]
MRVCAPVPRRWGLQVLVAAAGLALCLGAWAQRLRIGAEDDWRPYSYVVDGKPVGFAVDVARAAWAAAGVAVDLVPLPYARCMKEVDNGTLAGCFDTLRDARTESRYLWHKKPLFKARISIYGRADGSKDKVDLKSLSGRRIGVTNGYDYGEAFDNDPQMLRDVSPSDLVSMRKLAAGRVDYALVYDRVAQQIAKAYPELGLGIVQRGVLVEPLLYISFTKLQPGLESVIARFDTGLDRIHRSGEYARIEARWR